MSKIAFLGLDPMGYPMAGHLACEGHEVCVYDHDPALAERWCDEFGGECAGTPREAAGDAELLITRFEDAEHLRAVLTGSDGAFAGMHTGGLLIDHSLISADVAREIASLAARHGLDFLDAPACGSRANNQGAAQSGLLTLLVGGEASCYARAEPVLDSYALACKLMGPVGSGQRSRLTL